MTSPIQPTLVAIWSDPSLRITVAGILVTALGGAAGVLKDARRDKMPFTVVLLFLIAVGAVAAIGAAEDERTESQKALADSQRRFNQLHNDNIALKRQNAYLQHKADATYNTAVNVNKESAKILNDVDRGVAATKENLSTTTALGGETRLIASRADTLQIAAFNSLRQIERLASPLNNISMDYEIAVNIDDPPLSSLKAQLLSTAAKYREHVASAKPDNGVTTVPFPVFPVADILRDLPQYDPSSAFLRSMGLAIEMYRPPFPRRPYYGNLQRGRLVDASDSVDFLLETAAVDGHNVQLGFPVKRPPDLDVMVTAYFVPAIRAARSGRLDSIRDLPGSELLIHLLPDFFSVRTPGLLNAARLDGVVLNIDGTLHRIDLRKATIGEGPLFTYYAVKVPTSWRPSSYFIP